MLTTIRGHRLAAIAILLLSLVVFFFLWSFTMTVGR